VRIVERWWNGAWHFNRREFLGQLDDDRWGV
jgi:hypothetical protein